MKYFKNYTLSLSLYFIPMLMLFFYLQSYFDIFVSYIITILIIYIIYVTKNVIELCLVKVCLHLKINYFVIYPFSYDSSLLFNPISLINNFDGFQDNMYLNIPFDLTEDKCYKLYKNILIISKLSLLIASIFIGVIFQSFTSYIIFIILLISSFFFGLASFIRYNEFSYGADYIVKKYGIKLFLLQSNGYQYYDKSFFFDYLTSNQSYIEECMILKVFENYIYLMIQNKSVLSKEDMNLILSLMKRLEIQFYDRIFSPQFHVKFLNLLKIIILCFEDQFDQETLFQFQKIVEALRNFLVEKDDFGYLKQPIDSLNNYLVGSEGEDKYEFFNNIVFNMRTIFSYQKRIEGSIKSLCAKK